MIALDVGPLAAALNRHDPAHARAAALLEDLANGERPCALPWPVLHAFLALVTHPHAAARPLGAAAAWAFVAPLIASPALRLLAATPRHAETCEEVLAMLPASTLPPGFETAVVLREHGVRELLSSDPGMARFPFLAVRDPLREPGWTPTATPLRRYRRLA
jgi:predicted nucleic acid-binding protein